MSVDIRTRTRSNRSSCSSRTLRQTHRLDRCCDNAAIIIKVSSHFYTHRAQISAQVFTYWLKAHADLQRVVWNMFRHFGQNLYSTCLAEVSLFSAGALLWVNLSNTRVPLPKVVLVSQ